MANHISFDGFATQEGLFSEADIAKKLGIAPRKLKRILHAMEITFPTRIGQSLPYQHLPPHAWQLFHLVRVQVKNSEGKLRTEVGTYWTSEGVDWLIDKIERFGIRLQKCSSKAWKYVQGGAPNA